MRLSTGHQHVERADGEKEQHGDQQRLQARLCKRPEPAQQLFAVDAVRADRAASARKRSAALRTAGAGYARLGGDRAALAQRAQQHHRVLERARVAHIGAQQLGGGALRLVFDGRAADRLHIAEFRAGRTSSFSSAESGDGAQYSALPAMAARPSVYALSKVRL